MSDCLFCKIIKGEIPSTKVYEDEKVLAFLDITPINFGHTLVIPKNHSVNINDVGEEDLVEVMKVVKKVSNALLKMYDGVNIVNNNGKASGQLVEHFHVHVIPRSGNDSVEMFKCQHKKYTDEDKVEIQNKIKSFLK